MLSPIGILEQRAGPDTKQQYSTNTEVK